MKFNVEHQPPKTKPAPPSAAEGSMCGTAPSAMAGPIEKTSPTPGLPGPAAAKTTKSIKNIVRKVPRSQIEVRMKVIMGR